MSTALANEIKACLGASGGLLELRPGDYDQTYRIVLISGPIARQVLGEWHLYRWSKVAEVVGLEEKG